MTHLDVLMVHLITNYTRRHATQIPTLHPTCMYKGLAMRLGRQTAPPNDDLEKLKTASTIYQHGFTAHGSPHMMTWRNHFDMALFPAD